MRSISNIIMTKTKSGYDLKIGLKKLAKDAIIVILSGLIVVWQEDPRYIALIPIIKFGLNYLNHK